MFKSLRPYAFALAAAVSLPVSAAMAQGEFTPGTKIINLGLISDGSEGFGASFEYSLLELAPKLRLGVGGSFGYLSQDVGFGDFTYMPIMANANVHFALPEVPALDLFAGAAFGIGRVSYDSDIPAGGEASDSETIFGVNLGARYYFTPRVGAVAQLGLADAPELFLGITFKF